MRKIGRLDEKNPAELNFLAQVELENVADFLSDPVTKIWLLRDTGGSEKKKEWGKKILTYCVNKVKNPPWRTEARMRMPRINPNRPRDHVIT